MNVSWLTNTSVQDLQSSLSCAEVNGELNLGVLVEAYRIVVERGEKTKANILGRYVRRFNKINPAGEAMSEDQATYEVEQWAIVELMGHKVVAGKVSKSEMMGKPLLRVDVPAIGNNPAFTQMYGEAAIYCLTFVDEKTAIKSATYYQTKPIIPYITPDHQLPFQGDDDDDLCRDDTD